MKGHGVERSEITARIENRLPPDILDQPGEVLYIPWSSLRQGRFYFLGLNPGGDPKDSSNEGLVRTISDSLDLIPADWTGEDHIDEGSRGLPPGKPRLQKNVRAIIAATGQEPSDVFSVNAIFLRTPDSKGLSDLDPRTLWKDHFWPIHQMFLEVVKPDVIVCLGNGAGLSSWSLLLERAEERPCPKVTDLGYLEGKFADGVTLPLGSHQLWNGQVVGAPHPSRFPPREPVLEWLRRFASNRAD